MHVGFSQTLSAMIQQFSLTTNHRYRYALQSTKMVHTRGTRRMLLKIEQHRRLEMPLGSQSHPLWCALDYMSRETQCALDNFLSQSSIRSWVRCRAESDVLWTVPRKRPCTAEAWINRCHLVISNRYSSQTTWCCCLTLVGARRMLLRWLNYNVLIHIDGNIDQYANRSLLSYMEFQCKAFVIVYVTYF